MFADTTGIDVEIAREDRPGSLMGAAIIGAVAAGHFDSMDDATKSMTLDKDAYHGKSMYKPNKHAKPFFDELHEKYQSLAMYELERRQFEHQE